MAEKILQRGWHGWKVPLPLLEPRRRRVLARLVLSLFGRRIEVEGAERLNGVTGPAIFVFNHNNSFETLAVSAALLKLRRGRSVHFVVDWMFLQIPVLGWLLRQGDPVPVYGKRARWGLWEEYRQAHRHDSVVESCRRRLASGASVGLFPEGTRNRNPRALRRGRPGIAHLILQTANPVVPVGLEFPAARRLGRMPKVGRLQVRIGAPLDFAEERRRVAGADKPASSLTRAVVHRVMDRLADLSSKSYPFADPFRETICDPNPGRSS
ncbi:MAG: lysophospholipid acyltransferase family protein [Acidobacteriota bacterium]